MAILNLKTARKNRITHEIQNFEVNSCSWRPKLHFGRSHTFRRYRKPCDANGFMSSSRILSSQQRIYVLCTPLPSTGIIAGAGVYHRLGFPPTTAADFQGCPQVAPKQQQQIFSVAPELPPNNSSRFLKCNLRSFSRNCRYTMLVCVVFAL